MERGLKKLEIGKIGRYATPFDATKNTPMKGDGKSDGRNRRYGGDMSPARKAIVAVSYTHLTLPTTERV